jgi:hypothetical protein
MTITVQGRSVSLPRTLQIYRQYGGTSKHKASKRNEIPATSLNCMNRLYLAILYASVALLVIATIVITPRMDTKGSKPGVPPHRPFELPKQIGR